MKFIDTHVHFLPGIDDGPSDLQETIRMLRLAHAGGARQLIATPHMFFDRYDNTDSSRIRDHFKRTIETVEKLRSMPGGEFLREIELHLGAENYASPEFLEALRQNRVLSLCDSRYLLVEFPTGLPEPQFANTIDAVLQMGFVPVIAHCERYAIFQPDPPRVSRYLELGCLVQVNADSFERGFWSKTRKAAQALLNQDLVSLIASDAHGALSRPPLTEESLAKLVARFGEGKIGVAMWDHPLWIVSANSAKSQRR